MLITGINDVEYWSILSCGHSVEKLLIIETGLTSFVDKSDIRWG
jgi:hypothetical protein